MFLQNHFFVLLLLISPAIFASPLQEEQVSRWAKELGNELWNLGKTITKFSEIQGTYAFLNAQVEKKDPVKLLQDVVTDIERMMDRKMDAIRCISDMAEKTAESFVYQGTNYSYYSSKYSSVVNLTDPLNETRFGMYYPMKLNNDTHFYNLAVDTKRSSVHVPTNIFDKHEEPAFMIQWSEALNDVFTQNYKSDPALSWQYFGSSSGVMRHYPAKKWEEPPKKDLFDCRIRTWYIEAATCTKDVVILLDNSGSMDGMGKHIAALTAFSILETFSNNDYLNVLYYNLTTNYTIPCFEGKLVQATRENIRLFKKAVESLKPMGKTDLSQALESAFDLLSQYRELRGCNVTTDACNQAIMIITDGISKNLSDVIMKYNYMGDSNIPVRLFTYLIGQEVTNINEILWIACGNRGYHSHVQSLEQVTASVSEYINVVARPLVLSEEHPVSWTHAYADGTYDDKNDDQINEPYRLLTSVAVPAFDKKVNKLNDSRTAYLLGVAGTDVPIDDIEKLTQPYKIGVNAYAFIVSNNGYVLMHPDLRPVFEGHLTENFNSIDLSEVEQFDNDDGPRIIDEKLIILRHALVKGSKGNMSGISIKYHYDDRRRITREKYDYYYAPLKNTPFSIGFAIPEGYGHYSLDVGDEISKNRHTGAKISDFFKGDNWKIHPDWVYCKYHYLEGHEYKTPELELMHFLERMYNDTFTWEKQYEGENEDLDHVECGRKTHEDTDYYCDRQLIQRLVFDAKNTLGVFDGPWSYQSGEKPLFSRFNATLRFVATMSGLTRWEYMSQEVENVTKKEFGDLHSRAIDETWYKSAVLQHRYDRESFVYSVPFGSGVKEGLLVTASYAIFPSDAGVEAPGSVVGFQFAHQNLKQRFLEIATKVTNQCSECGHCNTTLDCYIIDSNGYIIISEDNNDTGTFFGEIEGDVMDSMINESIFEKITIYDFQGLCNRNDDEEDSGANYLSTPLDSFGRYLSLLLVKLVWLALEINMHTLWAPVSTLAQELLLYDNSTIEGDGEKDDEPLGDDDEEEDDEDYDDPNEDYFKANYYECDKKRELYVLQQHLFVHDNYPGEVLASRPFFVKKIPFSNLLFVAVNSTMPVVNPAKYTTSSQKLAYDNDTVFPCQKLYLNRLARRRLSGCFYEHPLEHEIKECGRSSSIDINVYLFGLVFITIVLIHVHT